MILMIKPRDDNVFISKHDYKSQKMWFHSPVLDGLAKERFIVAESEPNKNNYDLIIISTHMNSKLQYAQYD